MSFYDSFIDLDLTSFMRPQKNKNKNKTSKTSSSKKKHENWFESCTVSQLQDLCRAAKTLPVSGTKSQLVERLMGLPVTRNLGHASSVSSLKAQCKDQLLVQTGNKHDVVLRLLHSQFGTGAVKRAPTETIVDETTGKEVQVLKKRKTTPTPKVLYIRVQKKMNAVRQKKYQTHYGSKNHSSDVYNLMRNLINDHCIKEKMVESDPLLAMLMAQSVFQAFLDHWPVMERTGYETQVFREAVDDFAVILEAARPLMSNEQIETVVSLLESIEACVRGHCLAVRDEDPCVYYSTGQGQTRAQSFWSCSNYKPGVRYCKGQNVIQAAIRVVMPDYQQENRQPKKGKPLDCEVRNIAWMNGIILS